MYLANVIMGKSDLFLKSNPGRHESALSRNTPLVGDRALIRATRYGSLQPPVRHSYWPFLLST
jgi:hypothetical protein